MEFNADKMSKLIEQDLLLERMMNNLLESGTMSFTNCLEVVFNSEVLGDSIMEHAYEVINRGGN